MEDLCDGMQYCIILLVCFIVLPNSSAGIIFCFFGGDYMLINYFIYTEFWQIHVRLYKPRRGKSHKNVSFIYHSVIIYIYFYFSVTLNVGEIALFFIVKMCEIFFLRHMTVNYIYLLVFPIFILLQHKYKFVSQYPSLIYILEQYWETAYYSPNLSVL